MVTRYVPGLMEFEIRNSYMQLPHGDDFDFSPVPFTRKEAAEDSSDESEDDDDDDDDEDEDEDGDENDNDVNIGIQPGLCTNIYRIILRTDEH